MSINQNPAEAEANGVETVEVAWRDQTWTVPASPDDWPGEVLFELEDGHAAKFLAGVLTPGGQTFRKLVARKGWKTSDLAELVQVVLKAEGVDQGE